MRSRLDEFGDADVVGRDGRIAYLFRSDDPDDRRTVDELLAAVGSS